MKTEIDRAAASAPNPGRVETFHRLNRAEYKNAVRDLLLVDVDVASLLPADDSDRHGFDNTASMLSVSPTLIERYLSAAKKIGRIAVGIPSGGTARDTYQGVVYEIEDEQANASEELPFGSRGGLAVRHTFPVDAEYRLRVRLRRNGYDYIVGLAEPHQLEIRIDGERVKSFTVGGEAQGTPPPLGFAGNLPGSTEWEQYALGSDDKLKVRVPIKAGPRVVGVSFVSRPTRPEGIRQRPESAMSQSLTWDNPYGNPAVENIKIEGPYNVSGVSDTPSRRRLFVCRPAGCQRGTRLRAEDSVAGRAARLSTARDRCRSRDAHRLLQDRPQQGRLRCWHRARPRASPDRPELPVPYRTRSAESRARRRVPDQRSRSGIAALVLPLEQYSG